MNAGEEARFEPFVFSVSIFGDTYGPSIDLPMFIDLFLHPEILQPTDVPQWKCQELELQGASQIYIGLRLAFC